MEEQISIIYELEKDEKGILKWFNNLVDSEFKTKFGELIKKSEEINDINSLNIKNFFMENIPGICDYDISQSYKLTYENFKSLYIENLIDTDYSYDKRVLYFKKELEEIRRKIWDIQNAGYCD